MPVTRFAAVLAALLLVGCGASTPSATPEPSAAATAVEQATPTATATSSPTPTATPTPKPTPIPTPTPVPTPTPTPTPPPISEEALLAVCEGTPIPGAAKYAGKVHPLVVVTYDPDEKEWLLDLEEAINGMWYLEGWASPVQLVVCLSDKDVKVGSCGTYTRRSDGKSGQIIRYRYSTAARVIVAGTGKTLQSKTYYGSTPACASTLSIPASGSPPWALYGDGANRDAVNEMTMSLSGAGLFDADRLSEPFDVSGEPVGTSAATVKELVETVINGAVGHATLEDGSDKPLVEEAELRGGCAMESIGKIVRSSTGGDPATVVVDIAVPCMDNGRAGFRVEMTLANDDGEWTVTKATAQVYCPRGTCQSPSPEELALPVLTQDVLDWCDANPSLISLYEGSHELACRTAYSEIVIGSGADDE